MKNESKKEIKLWKVVFRRGGIKEDAEGRGSRGANGALMSVGHPLFCSYEGI